MKNSLVFLILVSATSAHAADALELKNGDFENGKQFWRGDGKVVTAKEGSKVLELKASERYGDEITQEVDMGKNTQCEVTFKMRSEGYTGNGLRVAMQRRGGGSTFTTRSVPADGNWTDFKWTFSRNTPDEKFTLTISPTMGKGSIQIDDVKIAATSANSPNIKQ